MNTWTEAIGDEKKQPYFLHILQQVNQARADGATVFPAPDDVFNAFRFTQFKDVKVVILGQDPYHGVGQAHGLAFSVQPNIAIPPSLQNIYKELAQDIDGFTIPQHGYLQEWAEQGVLLLNTVLTVEQGKPQSHAKFGWETFTDHVIKVLNDKRDGIVFLLWGSHAQKKGAFIDRTRHCVFTAPHPSPLSAHRGFFGCRHFSKTNDYLRTQGLSEINWQISPITQD